MPEKISSRFHPRRTLVVTGLGVAATLAVLLVEFWGPLIFQSTLDHAENYFQDRFTRTGRFTPANTNLVLVGIDRPSYDDTILPVEAQNDPVQAALCGRFPWSRIVWAALINRLSDAGAKVIVLDLVFASDADGDDALRAALNQHKDRVVIGSSLNLVNTERGTLNGMTTPDSALIPDLDELPGALDSRVGFINIWPDADDIFRRARLRASNHEMGDILSAPAAATIESVAERVLHQAGATRQIATPAELQRIRFTGPPGTFPIIPLSDILTPKLWAANYGQGEFFRNKIVLVGPTANYFQDLHRTPFPTEMAGPEIHLNIINAALHGEFFQESPPLATACIVLAGFIASAVCLFIRSQRQRLLTILAVSVVGFLAVQFAFNHLNLVLPVISPLLVLGVTGLGALGYDFTMERLERIKLRHTMGLYFSPRVLEAVLADPGSMRPRHADVTLLLTDLRNSTPLAEALGPQGMFDLLNRVFEAQTSAIMGEEGNLEHFLGDQFLSYWGAPNRQPDAADRAERAAMKLIRAMEQLRATLPPEIQKLFGYGVALHSGRVLVGNKGSALRLDYGLVGDAVNEAARVEALTKYYGVHLLVTRDTYAQFSTQGTRRLLDRIIVKGKSEPVELFECENPLTISNYRELCIRYKAAYDAYYLGQFGEALLQFQKLVADYSDGPSKALAERCQLLAVNPPKPWNGIWKMDAK